MDTYQPLSVVERESFKSMIRCINPRASVPSREQVCEWLDEYEELAREDILERLKHEHPALTSDAWTSLTQDAYLSLTAHYISSEWIQVIIQMQ